MLQGDKSITAEANATHTYVVLHAHPRNTQVANVKNEKHANPTNAEYISQPFNYKILCYCGITIRSF